MCDFLLDLDEYVDSRNFWNECRAVREAYGTGYALFLDTSCDILVYMIILSIVDFFIHE